MREFIRSLMNLKIKYFLITAVLITAVLCFGAIPNVTKAACSAGNEITCQINALLDQIKALQAQIAQLQAQQGTTQWCHTFNTNLRLGDSGAEVLALDKALEKEGFSVNEQKDNPPFAEPTASAVTGFQEKYASEILTPLGLKYGTGYFGPATRKKLNALYRCGITTCPTELPNCPVGTTPQSYVGSDGCTHFKCVPLTVCAQDMYTCPNGISVSRTGPNCQFVCPRTTCVAEGGTVTGPVAPEYATHCCPGLVAQYPSGLVGASGICVRPPTSNITINSVSGPNSLNVGQTGTWMVNATAPSGTNLTYNVDWGDMVYPIAAGAANISQTATFTHSYNQAGTYTIKFTVSGRSVCPSCPAGMVCQLEPCVPPNSAQTSITVVVGQTGNLSITVPSDLNGFAGQFYSKTFSVGVPTTGGRTYSWATDGSLPPGLNLEYNTVCASCAAATGTVAPSCLGGPCYTNTSIINLVGTPTAYGIYSFTLKVKDDIGSTGSVKLMVSIGSITQPLITVTSPNGGESLIVGRPLTINWNTTGFSSSDSVQISLYDSSINCGSIPAPGCWTTFPLVWNGVKNTGSYTWDTNTYFGDPGPYNPLYLSQHISTGAVYKIKLDIVGLNGAKATDYSDNYFSIVVPLF